MDTIEGDPVVDEDGAASCITVTDSIYDRCIEVTPARAPVKCSHSRLHRAYALLNAMGSNEREPKKGREKVR